MWYIIKINYFKTSIDDVDFHTPYFDVFVWRPWSMKSDVRNITTKPIISSAGYVDRILIEKSPTLFLVNWVQQRIYFDIRKWLIWYLAFTIEGIWTSTYSLNYDVHVMTCIHEFRRSCWWSMFINLDEWKYLILINQCSDRKFWDVKKWTFASGWKFKGV